MECRQPGRRCELENYRSLSEKQGVLDNIQRLGLRSGDIRGSRLEPASSADRHESQLDGQEGCPCLEIYDLLLMKRVIRVPHDSNLAQLRKHSLEKFKTFRIEVNGRHHRETGDIPARMRQALDQL